MTVVLDFTGPQTVREAEQVAGRLREALSGGGEVLLDCGRIEEVDLTFIQLVIAARKSAERDGKTLTLQSPAQGPLLKALDLAGILPGGPQNFWFEGKNAA